MRALTDDACGVFVAGAAVADEAPRAVAQLVQLVTARPERHVKRSCSHNEQTSSCSERETVQLAKDLLLFVNL